MAVTDTYIGDDVIYRVLENGNADADFAGASPLLTTMFTFTEIRDSMDRVQQKFLLDTGMIVTRAAPIALGIGTGTYDLPTDNIVVRRVSITDANSVTTSLTQAETWELDTSLNSWPTDSGTPIVWFENTLPPQRLGIAPSPIDVGSINVLYVALATTLSGLGVNLAIPDDWSPYITWGTLAELLSSDGESFDPLRAQYCTRRYNEGVELARLVLGGR